jgi:hypothetical protein
MIEWYVIPLLIISVGTAISALVSWPTRRHAPPKFDPWEQAV